MSSNKTGSYEAMRIYGKEQTTHKFRQSHGLNASQPVVVRCCCGSDYNNQQILATFKNNIG